MNRATPEREDVVIALGDPSARGVDPAVLDAPGGFAWWYVDTLDARGDGAVVIWSFGLPFLPGYLSGARAGHGAPARSRPSLNIALYRGGRRAFYLLQEGPAELDGDGTFRFGSSCIDRPSPGRVRLTLDQPIPGSRERLQGELVVEGPPARLEPGLSPSPDLSHRWTPVLGPARARGTLTAGAERYAIDGPAYHDRNEGTRRFDDLGIALWIWGRVVAEHRTAVWYVNYPRSGDPLAWGAELASDGAVRLVQGLEPVLEGKRVGVFGLPTWERVRLRPSNGVDWLDARIGPRVDDGPFYARTTARVRAGVDEGVGLGEWIAPARIDLGRHRPLVRMAVHRLEGPNSMWLPLFSGPSAGRLRRLVGLGSGRATSADDAAATEARS